MAAKLKLLQGHMHLLNLVWFYAHVLLSFYTHSLNVSTC